MKYITRLIKSKYFTRNIVFIILFIVAGEIFARSYLGLGDPPLSVAHPTIEYLYKPNQARYRFGNHFVVNQYGMRAESFAIHKSINELRVMVFGDSVVNGGNLTDQPKLATSILKDRLSKISTKNVVVGNISAGSWGPGNWLAYAKKYGFFDTDIVVLVLSSHDYADNPTFEPLNNNTHPTEKPTLALIEGIERYLPRYLPQNPSNKFITETEQSNAEENQKKAQKIGLNDLKNFLELAKKNSRTVLVFQHYEKSEIESGNAQLGNQLIKATCKQLGLIPTSLESYFRSSIQSGIDPFRDNIHPNEAGQRLIADAILAKIP